MTKIPWWQNRSAESQLDVAEVYRQYGRLIWATLHRLGVAESDLPDVMQEVLIVIHRRLPSYDPNSRLESWMFGICAKVVANYRRRAFRRHERSVPELEPTDLCNPEALNSMRDDRAALDAVLDRIDAPKRAVFLMFEIEGLSCQQIADELSLPLGTVHSRLHGARREFAASICRTRPRDGVAEPPPRQDETRTETQSEALARRCVP